MGTHFWGHPRGEQRVGTHWHWVALISTAKKQKGKKIPWKTRIFLGKYCLGLGRIQLEAAVSGCAKGLL